MGGWVYREEEIGGVLVNISDAVFDVLSNISDAVLDVRPCLEARSEAEVDPRVRETALF